MIDVSGEALALLKARTGGRVEAIQSDVLSFDDPRRFDMALAIDGQLIAGHGRRVFADCGDQQEQLAQSLERNVGQKTVALQHRLPGRVQLCTANGGILSRFCCGIFVDAASIQLKLCAGQRLRCNREDVSPRRLGRAKPMAFDGGQESGRTYVHQRC